jgi:protein-S-isoprenylcysteine O-methyltransferase Ste14
MFIVPLLIGFGLNWASAFTAAYSRRWGESGGRLASAILRNVLGIPVWVVGLVLALQEPSPPLFQPTPLTLAVVTVLVAAGAALVVTALWSLGLRAAAPSVGDTLVRRGPYAHLRHPIYAGAMLQFAGLALRWPSPPVLLACGLALVWAGVQARLEEQDLLQRLPGYHQYMAEVPRFVPRLKG